MELAEIVDDQRKRLSSEDTPRRQATKKLTEIHRLCSEVSHSPTSPKSEISSHTRDRSRTVLSDPVAKSKTVFQALGEALFAPAKKKEVKFGKNAITQATVEILSFVGTDPGDEGDEYQREVSAKLATEEEEPQCCCTRVCSALRKEDSGDHSRIESEFYGIDINVNDVANTWMEKFLWKFNSTAEFDTEGATILKWRHRLFLLQECHGQLAMMYTSEKNNGSLHLGCIVYHGATQQLATTRALPKIELESMDHDTKMAVATNMQDYDIAFATRNTYDYYIERMPTCLYPVEILWTHKAGAVLGEHRRFIVASSTPEGQTKLLKDISSVTQMLRWKSQ